VKLNYITFSNSEFFYIMARGRTHKYKFVRQINYISNLYNSVCEFYNVENSPTQVTKKWYNSTWQFSKQFKKDNSNIFPSQFDRHRFQDSSHSNSHRFRRSNALQEMLKGFIPFITPIKIITFLCLDKMSIPNFYVGLIC